MVITDVKNLQELVSFAASEYGDKAFLKEKDGKDIKETSFDNFFDGSRRVCSFLKECGKGEKLHAAVIGATSSGYLMSYFGTVMGGNVIVPLDAQLSAGDLCDLLVRADVSVFFYDSRFEAILDDIKAGCPDIHTYVSIQNSDKAQVSLPDIIEKYEPAVLPEITPDQLAAIVYTSGTTGKAKGVMLTHGNLIDNTMCCDDESSPEDVLLTVLPIHHVYCFTCDILLSLRYGPTICVNDAMMRIAQNLKLFQPTIILLVPMIAETIYKQINAASKAKNIPAAAVAQSIFGGKLKVIFSGGAYLSPELMKAYADIGIPISQGYGMTECSPRISSGKLGDLSGEDVGRIVKGCEVKIADGEIVVKSPSVMQGYYKMPAETAEAIDAEGWLHTGDLGYVENGRIFITGRKKNLIILSNGENVSPEELENKFAAVDMAAEVLVYAEEGVITAEIFPSAEVCGEMSREEIGAKLNDIISGINKTLPSAKAIRRLRLRDAEFDKTTSKKIRRQQAVQGDIV